MRTVRMSWRRSTGPPLLQSSDQRRNWRAIVDRELKPTRSATWPSAQSSLLEQARGGERALALQVGVRRDAVQLGEQPQEVELRQAGRPRHLGEPDVAFVGRVHEVDREREAAMDFALGGRLQRRQPLDPLREPPVMGEHPLEQELELLLVPAGILHAGIQPVLNVAQHRRDHGIVRLQRLGELDRPRRLGRRRRDARSTVVLERAEDLLGEARPEEDREGLDLDFDSKRLP